MSLRQRIAFTVGALIIYRFGSYIPLPGINPSAAGFGGNRPTAIFAISIFPYISAAIFVQFVMLIFARQTLNQQGHRGRQTMLNWTRGLTVLIAVSQASGIAYGLQQVPGIVVTPGPWFELSTILTLTAGTMLLIWIADQITMRGIGNGIALILAAGVAAELPSSLAFMLELWRRGALSSGLILIVLGIAVALVAMIVFMESARRDVAVEYSSHANSGRAAELVSAPISLKMNPSGIIPLFFASWLLGLLTTIANFNTGQGPRWLQWIIVNFSHGRPLFLLSYLAAIVIVVWLYAAFVLNPKRASATLEKQGGVIPGAPPGVSTENYFDFVVSRITILGGLYLAFVCIVPELLISYAAVPFYLGGSALLVVVCTAMDIGAQYRQQAHLEEGGYRQ